MPDPTSKGTSRDKSASSMLPRLDNVNSMVSIRPDEEVLQDHEQVASERILNHGLNKAKTVKIDKDEFVTLQWRRNTSESK